MKDKTSKFTGIMRTRQDPVTGEGNTPATPPRGRPGGQGKRGNPLYTQATAYITKRVHDETKVNLIRQGNREFSELVEELLAAWNLNQTAK